MSKHNFRDKEAQLKQAAAIASQRRTCEGCAYLRTHLRPMCQAEHGPNFRHVRDTYSDRCGAYAVRGRDGKPTERKPEPPPILKPKPKRMRLVEVRGENRAIPEDEYDRLLARNRARRQA
jgi:hypothetical protein